MFSRDDSARAPPFSSKDSRAYEATRAGVRTDPESARRILIMRAKLWASSRRWNICVFAGRGLWLNYHSLFPLRAVDLRRPLPAPRESQRHPTFPSLPSPFFPQRIVFTLESMKKNSQKDARRKKNIINITTCGFFKSYVRIQLSSLVIEFRIDYLLVITAFRHG